MATEIYQSDDELRDPGDVIDEQDEAGRLSEEIDFHFMDFLQSNSTSPSNENRQPPSPPARDPRLQPQNTTEQETPLRMEDHFKNNRRPKVFGFLYIKILKVEIRAIEFFISR